jgi:hypothetical protein
MFLGIYNSQLDNSVGSSWKENIEYILGGFVRFCQIMFMM